MINAQKLTLGLPGGNLQKISIEIMKAAGLAFEPIGQRQLYTPVSHPMFREVIFCSPRDIPQLLDRGILDVGLTGQDCFEEWELGNPWNQVQALGSHLPLSKTKLASSRVCLLTRTDEERAEPDNQERILTEFPNITQVMFPDSLPVPVRGTLEGLMGSGKFRFAVTVVETGTSVRANALRIQKVLRTSNPELYCTDAVWLQHFDDKGPLWEFMRRLEAAALQAHA